MKRINVADLPEFDAAPYLGSEAAIAAYLTDILEANDAALLEFALGDIARLWKLKLDTAAPAAAAAPAAG